LLLLECGRLLNPVILSIDLRQLNAWCSKNLTVLHLLVDAGNIAKTGIGILLAAQLYI
jgi:hypothetical protein